MLDSVTYEVFTVSSPTTLKTLGFIGVSYEDYRKWMDAGHWKDMVVFAKEQARKYWRLEDFPCLHLHSKSWIEKR